MMHIEIPGRALVSIEGAIDAAIIRTVLEGDSQAGWPAIRLNSGG
jgi:hypothetical protein